MSSGNPLNNNTLTLSERLRATTEAEAQQRARDEADQRWVRSTTPYYRTVERQAPELIQERRGRNAAQATAEKDTPQSRSVSAPGKGRKVKAAKAGKSAKASKKSKTTKPSASDRFVNRDLGVEHERQALNVIGAGEAKAARLLRPLEAFANDPRAFPAATAAEQFLSVFTQYNLLTGQREVHTEAMVTRFREFLSEPLPVAQRYQMLQALLSALAFQEPQAFAEAAGPLQQAFVELDVFHIDGPQVPAPTRDRDGGGSYAQEQEPDEEEGQGSDYDAEEVTQKDQALLTRPTKDDSVFSDYLDEDDRKAHVLARRYRVTR